ncbi:hypothetical protein M404DRAFT_508608 [Pisolithus tinctorius Marx 270]|uniref:Uncharacterized protein n=1 Tax=Pisolithus tinctorius Marx 270 TaxID=870435 RepID=A0A0C3PDQ6_PISTI|nr:hypothetical protein M404DRAFT_508608 [Pisolithus tinctorius Marx 270]
MGMLLSSRQQRTRRRDVNGCTCTFQWHCFASSSKDLETVKCEMKTVDNGIMNHRDIPSCSSVRTATNLYNGNCAKERLGRKTYLQRGRTHVGSNRCQTIRDAERHAIMDVASVSKRFTPSDYPGEFSEGTCF